MTSALVAREPGVTEIVNIELGEPRHGEVSVDTIFSGVCGSDARVSNGTSRLASYPMILGHEGVGIVREVGPGVSTIRVGDLIVTLPYAPCESCGPCLAGVPLGCSGQQRNFARAGLMVDGTSRSTDQGSPLKSYLGIGSLADRFVINARQAHVVRKDIPPAALVQLTCGMLTGLSAAWNLAAMSQARTIVVIGCGVVGRGIIQGARTLGIERIVAVDQIASRLDQAKRAGATEALLVPSSCAEAALNEIGADVAFEAAGTASAFELALASTHTRGICVVVGGPPPGTALAVDTDLLFAGRTIIGAPNGNGVPGQTLTRALESFTKGILRLEDPAHQNFCTLQQILANSLPTPDGSFYATRANVVQSGTFVGEQI